MFSENIIKSIIIDLILVIISCLSALSLVGYSNETIGYALITGLLLFIILIIIDLLLKYSEI